MMVERRDFIALDWVAGEIRETLGQASQSLKAYIANRDDATRLRFALTYIHQVQGTLQMVEFFSAALIAAEMEQCAQALLNQQIGESHEEAALAALEAALSQLPAYIARVRDERRDQPVDLVPLVNDLRAVQGRELLSTTALFNPVIPPSEARGELMLRGPELLEVAQKLRQMYQIALLGLIRDRDLRKNINYMAKVCARLVKLSAGRPPEALWKVCIALLEGLLNRSIEARAAVKILLRQVDAELKHLVVDGESALEREPPADLLTNLLFYIAISAANSRFLKEIKSDYQLERTLFAARSADAETAAMEAVLERMAAELAQVIAQLDAGLPARADERRERSQTLRANLQPSLDVLAVLGLGPARKAMQEQAQLLERATADGEVSGQDIAQRLREILAELGQSTALPGREEKTLFNNSEEAQEQLDKAFDSILRESRRGLEAAKEAIIEFVATQWQHECLQEAPAVLAEVEGSLRLAQLQRAALVIQGCRRYVNEQLLEKSVVPEWQVLDTLADAITSIDYYLERLADDADTESDTILRVAEQSVTELGYPAGEGDSGGTRNMKDAPDSAEVIPFLRPEDEPATEESTPEQDMAPVENGAESDEHVAGPGIKTNAPEQPPVLELDSEVDEDDTAGSDESAAELSLESADEELPESSAEQGAPQEVDGHATATDTADPDAGTDTPEAAEPPDPEIVEIFIEEAREVLDTIAETWPAWTESPRDEELLTVIRRSFHTLKGSGRMVEAHTIGEMAWSVENMLNRVIDGTLELDQQRIALVDEARALVPELIEAFEHGREPASAGDVQALMERAFVLAAEQNPADAATETSDENFDDVPDVGSEQQPFAPDDDVSAEPEAQEPADQEQAGAGGADEHTESELFAEEHDGSVDEQLPDTQLADEGSERDDVLLEIFAGEAATHLETLEQFTRHGRALAGPAELSDELQRALHTLKGSAQMADVAPVAQVVTPLEHLIKELRAVQAKADDAVLEVLEQASNFIAVGIAQLGSEPDRELPGVLEYLSTLAALHRDRVLDSRTRGGASEQLSPDTIGNFLQDAIEGLSTVAEAVERWHRDDLVREAVMALPEAVGRVAEAADSINLHPVAELAQALTQLLERGAFAEEKPGQQFFDLCNRACERLIDQLDQLAGHQQPEPDARLLAALRDCEIADKDFASSEPETGVEPFVEDQALSYSDLEAQHSAGGEPESEAPEVGDDGIPAREHAAESSEATDDAQWEEEIDYGAVAEVPQVDDDPEAAASGELATEATWADVEDDEDQHADDDRSVDLEAEPEWDAAESVTDDLNGVGLPGSDGTEDWSDSDAATADSTEAGAHQESELSDSQFLDSDEPAAAEDSDDHQAAESTDNELPPLAEVGTDTAAQDDDDEVDAEIREIFLEEADDLLEAIDETIHKWSGGPTDSAHLSEMQRLLHTLKGGARLAGLSNLGNLSHNFETFLINAEQRDETIDAAFLARVQQYQDQLMQQLETVKSGGGDAPQAETPPEPPQTEWTQESEDEPTESEAEDPSDAAAELEPEFDAPEPSGNVVPFAREGEQRQEVVPFVARTPAADGGGDSRRAHKAPGMAPQPRRAPQEMVKVSSQLLEDLVNLAGETSIARGRSEEQVSELVFSLDEMQITVERLQEQVRRLDIETEQQILFRQEQVESEGLEGFDPLEFDRYSLLQQLSRSLMESASDLTDIRGTLADKSRDMETLLLQQSRINTDLQEGLMRSRMVPFSRMVPRLRRIVRQVSGELNKKVEFEVLNAEGELDRSVLERIVAPLEHMLRNAVDHGVETVAEREAAGKRGSGRIQLGLGREGGEVVLTLQDDGRGVDLEAVKRKAIERGLMNASANLSDHEVLQFIMSSGFSTAQQVTQISGRGVGMDVVHSEIKQLGGSVEIQSDFGRGTLFTVRLPFTVSVNRALMVSVGGDVYAVPLNTIEGIVRVSPFELEAYYQPDAPLFEYAGQPYLLRYMGSLLHAGDKPILDGQTMPLPVILVRGAEHAVAVQVDSLLGSREIVVKTLGPQFGMVQGLSGATVLGDGSVVVILDLLAMIRADASHLHRDLEFDGEERAQPEERSLLVMVVDDSVTVRKVTSRFLERQGMEVWLAKDGVDAITVLQEQERVPDVMLLDIEMPRMDGFEVASRMRHTSRWEQMPIIMITSRTGEKHRERALSLGVNQYLGKPYQEMELLNTIRELTGSSGDDD